MKHIVGTLEQLSSFCSAVNAAEGLPRPPDKVVGASFAIQADWEPTEERPEPPVGWTVRYYDLDNAVELEDGSFHLTVEERHLIHLVEGITLLPAEGST